MQEEIIRVTEETDGRARARIDQMEREKVAYEKRLRDKYADMVKELEGQHRYGLFASVNVVQTPLLSHSGYSVNCQL